MVFKTKLWFFLKGRDFRIIVYLCSGLLSNNLKGVKKGRIIWLLFALRCGPWVLTNISEVVYIHTSFLIYEYNSVWWCLILSACFPKICSKNNFGRKCIGLSGANNEQTNDSLNNAYTRHRCRCTTCFGVNQHERTERLYDAPFTKTQFALFNQICTIYFRNYTWQKIFDQ